MAHLIDLFAELRDIVYNHGICAESSKLALILRTEVSNYFHTSIPYFLDNRQVACDIVKRVDRLMINIIGVDLSTHEGFWISQLNNLQTDLFNFLRKIKICGRETNMDFGSWYSIYGNDYLKKSHAYQVWTRLKDRRNYILNLSNLPVTREFKARLNLSAFKGVYITKILDSGKSAMACAASKRSCPFDVEFPIKLQKLDESSGSPIATILPTVPTTSSSSSKSSSLDKHTASFLACAILPYDHEMGVSVSDWQYARASFDDPDDIRLMNIKKHQAASQYHKLEIVRLIKKYSIGESRRFGICRGKLRLLCDWLIDDTPIIID